MNKTVVLFLALSISIRAQEATDDCADNLPDCKMRSKNCNKPKFKELRDQMCRKTCGNCNDSSVHIPFTGQIEKRQDAWEEWGALINILNPSNSCPVKEEFLAETRVQFSMEHWKFAWNLYSSIISQNDSGTAPSGKNLVFSPISVSIILALIYEGAQNETATEIEQFIFNGLERDDVRKAYVSILKHISERDKDQNKVFAGNMIYVDHRHKLSSNYRDVVQKCYDAQVAFTKIGPDLAPTINKAVNDFTDGRISSFIDGSSITNNMRMIMLNAIYFRAFWEQPFTKGEVLQERFHIDEIQTKRAPFMMIKGTFPFYKTKKKNGGMQILGLPYKGREQTMFLILPTKKNDLNKVERNLRPKQLINKLANLKEQEVNVFIPKFTVESSLAMEKYMQASGLAKLFTPEAELGRMTQGRKKLFVSDIFHKSIIEVHENGTVAAAATGAAFTDLKRQNSFMATHPFMFLIRDNPTNTILFIGRISDPTD